MSGIPVIAAPKLLSRLAGLIPALLVVLAAAMLFIGGQVTGKREAQATYKAAIAAIDLNHAQDLARQRADALADLEAAVALGERLQAEVDALSERREQAVRTIIKRIPDVTTIYLPAPGAEPAALPACPFTVGYQRLWNAALSLDGAASANVHRAAGLDAAASAAADPADAGSGVEPGTAADSALAIAAGIDPAALLTNHTLNAERCAGIETSRAALIQWIRDRSAAPAAEASSDR